jgi:hypothetical protein
MPKDLIRGLGLCPLPEETGILIPKNSLSLFEKGSTVLASRVSSAKPDTYQCVEIFLENTFQALL